MRTHGYSVSGCEHGFYVHTYFRDEGIVGVVGPRVSEYFATEADAAERKSVMEKIDAVAPSDAPALALGVLLSAASRNDVAVAERVLRDHGAAMAERLSVELPGNSAVHAAAGARAHEVLTLLLDYGASPNIPNHRNETPLHVVTVKRAFKSAEILLSYGADSTLKNNYGHTPKKAAEDYRDEDMLTLFAIHEREKAAPAQSPGMR